MKKTLWFTLIFIFSLIITGCIVEQPKKAVNKDTTKVKVTYQAQSTPEKEKEIATTPTDTQPANVPTPSPAPTTAPSSNTIPKVTPKPAPTPVPSNGGQQNDSGFVGTYQDLLNHVEQGKPVTTAADPKIMQAYNKAKEIVGSITNSGMTEFQKEKALHDYLLTHITGDSSYPDRTNPYGGLILGKANCDGYAESFQLLLNLAGVNAVEIIGTLTGQQHAWNEVQINGNWYQVDVSHDRGFTVRYDYFNKSDAEMSAKGYFKQYGPPCTTTFVWPQ